MLKKEKTEIGGVDKSRAEAKQYQLEVRQTDRTTCFFGGKA